MVIPFELPGNEWPTWHGAGQREVLKALKYTFTVVMTGIVLIAVIEICSGKPHLRGIFRCEPQLLLLTIYRFAGGLLDHIRPSVHS